MARPKGATAIIRKMLCEGASTEDIINAVGCSKPTVSYHRKKIGMGVTLHSADWEAVQAFYDQGNSLRRCLQEFDLSRAAWYRAVDRGDIMPRPDHRIPLKDLLVRGRARSLGHTKGGSRKSIKRRLIKAGLLTNVCATCGQGPRWNGKRLVLHLDHKNGDWDDYRIENLHILCPNCHSQTDTYAGRSSSRVKIT